MIVASKPPRRYKKLFSTNLDLYELRRNRSHPGPKLVHNKCKINDGYVGDLTELSPVRKMRVTKTEGEAVLDSVGDNGTGNSIGTGTNTRNLFHFETPWQMKERLDNENNGYGLDEIHDTGSGNDGNREAKARVAKVNEAD